MAYAFNYPPFANIMLRHKSELPQIDPNKTSIVAYPQASSEYETLPHKSDRQSLLEWRIGVQESITVGLLDKISLFKGEMLEQLKVCKRLEREQLKNTDTFNNEIRVLSESLDKMNRDIQAFEENVRDKWKTVNAAAVTLRNLENHHVSSLADVRSRIARGDQAITTLSQKVNQLGEELRALNEFHKRELVEVTGTLKQNEQKTGDLSAEIERSKSNTAVAIKQTEDNMNQYMNELERRINQQLTEIHHQIQRSAADCMDERHRLEGRTIEAMNNLIQGIETRLTDAERVASEVKPDEELIGRVDELEPDLANFKQQVLKTFKELESRINRMAVDLFDQQRKSVEEVRNEMRQGFVTMHDSLMNMKSVLENKMRISEENFQLELAQLRKLVVLI